MTNIIERNPNPEIISSLISSGIPPLLAKLFVARGISNKEDIGETFSQLLPPSTLQNNLQMAKYLADAIVQNKQMVIIGDYDCDGATATAVGVRGLKQMGANVDYLVPNRFEYGYGLTPEIVALAIKTKHPDILITVDNGIASCEGVQYAIDHNLDVFITDHHLPADQLPSAKCIVNPNQKSCSFGSPNLAGVGVIFYVLLALRSELRERGAFQGKIEPPLTDLLDIVALGTVADLVKLDKNNRILVTQGLKRIRSGKASPLLTALIEITGKIPAKLKINDLAMSLAPRINAAGRLADMSLGIAGLISDDTKFARNVAIELDSLNTERRNIEESTTESALSNLQEILSFSTEKLSICLFDPDWHQGVVGITASRIKEKYYRPTIIFARSTENGVLKGSGRSTSSLHLRDALDLITKKHPDLIIRFGGHAFAAGVAIAESNFEAFCQAFEWAVGQYCLLADFQETITVDGELDVQDMTLDNAQCLENEVWGQGFPYPLFYGRFKILEQKVLNDAHLKLTLRHLGDPSGRVFNGIFFRQKQLLPEKSKLIFELSNNFFQGTNNLQLLIKQAIDG